MKFAVMGAGAVGCYFGARLKQAGHDVVLVGRAPLVEAVHARGLHLQMNGFDGHIAIEASTAVSAVNDADVVLFCVKSADTESAGAAMLPFIGPGCAVLCLQNGVDNAPRLSRVLGFDAIATAVYVAVSVAGPGHVLHNGRGELVMGQSPDSVGISRAFGEAGIPVTVTEKVLDALWAKLAANCAYNALSALTQLPYGELIQRPGMQQTMRAAVSECCAVAAAEGIELPDSLWDDVLALSRSMATQRSSTAQDLARGRPTEIDYINGHIVRTADLRGLDVPVNRVLHGLVKIAEHNG